MTTYRELGHFIIGQTYKILLENGGEIGYLDLKYKIGQEIVKRQNIDQSYAMHRYNVRYNVGKYCSHRHRWKAVFDHCIKIQLRAFHLQKVSHTIDERYDLVRDVLVIRPETYARLDKEHPEKMLDSARNIWEKGMELALNIR